jgi:hypothetical protein
MLKIIGIAAVTYVLFALGIAQLFFGIVSVMAAWLAGIVI